LSWVHVRFVQREHYTTSAILPISERSSLIRKRYKTEWISIVSMPSVVLDTFYTYTYTSDGRWSVTLLYIRVAIQFAFRQCLFVFTFMHLFRMAIILVKWTPGREGCSRRGPAENKGGKSRSTFARWYLTNFAPARVSPRIRRSASTSFIRAFLFFLREWPTLRFIDFATFRVVSRPDFSCYLFDESWRCFAEFRGNPGCIVPRRRSGRGQNEGGTRVKARERDSEQRIRHDTGR